MPRRPVSKEPYGIVEAFTDRSSIESFRHVAFTLAAILPPDPGARQQETESKRAHVRGALAYRGARRMASMETIIQVQSRYKTHCWWRQLIL